MKHLPIPLALVLLLTACGGDTDTTTPEPDPAPGSNWQLVWSDEFDGSAIDATKWTHEVNCAGGGNNELQCYTARPENSFVADGLLNIVARQEPWQGPAHFDDDPAYDATDTSASRAYTSARLRTKGKGDWQYGRMEIRAKLPQGQGIWPALWMLPTHWVYGGWPASGEIDIMEAVNTNAAGGNQVHGTLHYGRYAPENSYTGTATEPATSVAENFHDYAVEWDAAEIRWYLNGQQFASQGPASESQSGWYNYYWKNQAEGFVFGEQGAPFDQLFHLIANLAVGGNWPGNPDAGTQFPQALQLDYVRIYQCAEGADCSAAPALRLPGHARPQQRDLVIYHNGLQSVPVQQAGDSAQQPLALGYYDGGQAGLVTLSEPRVDDSKVWQLDFAGAGNGFVSVTDSPIAGADTGLMLENMHNYGELLFNLRVLSRDSDSRLTVKLDSGWPNVSVKDIDLPADDSWTRVSVPLAQLAANPVQPGQVDLSNIRNLFVLEASGAISVQIDDLRLRCLASCAVAPRVPPVSLTEDTLLYGDAVDARWALGLWETGSPHILFDQPAVDGRGQVLDVQFSNNAANGIFFLQSDSSMDFSAFADGQLRFDVRVLDYGLAPALVLRADCGHPCSSGDINLGQPGFNAWQTVQVPVAELVAGGLDLAQVNTPFVLMPAWDAQAGVHLQVDNVQWLLP